MTFTKTLAFSLLLTLGVAACGGASDDGAAGEAGTTAGTTESGTADSDTASGEAKVYESHGVVTKIDTERTRVTLDHEKIDGWMDAMEMPFPVADASLLEGLEIGKRYAFTVEVRNAKYRITKLTPAQ